MQTTTNIGLKTYEANDPTDWLGEFNYNMNKIDTAVGNQSSTITEIETTANSAEATANTASTTANNALTVANSKPTLDDTTATTTTTYSSSKIEEEISAVNTIAENAVSIASGKATINDNSASSTTTYSSNKINTEVSAVETIANSKASINDTTASSSATYSSTKINTLLSAKQNKSWTLLTTITPTTSYVNYTVSNLNNYTDLVFELQHDQYTADSCFIPDTMFVNADTVVLQDIDASTSTRNLFNIGYVNNTTIKAKCELVWSGYSIKVYAR